MRHSPNFSQYGSVNEMLIVDTFTRLIFADIAQFDARERRVLAALRSVNANVLRDTPEQIGEYLRTLGVREMIHLVARIREHIEMDARVVPCGAKDGVTAQRRNSGP